MNVVRSYGNTTGCNPSDPTSWTETRYPIGELTNPPFMKAGNTPRLLKAFYQLAGDNWIKKNLWALFPIRFPVKRKLLIPDGMWMPVSQASIFKTIFNGESISNQEVVPCSCFFVFRCY